MKNYRIATVVKIYPHPWFKRAKEGVKKFSEDTGHETFLVGPPTIDGMLQAQIIKNLLEQEKVDALCVIPFFPEALERARESEESPAQEAQHPKAIHHPG